MHKIISATASIILSVAFYGCIPAGPCLGAAIISETRDAAGTRLILENEYLRAVLDPAKGGSGIDLIHKKSDRNVVFPGQGKEAAFLQDRVTQNTGGDDFMAANYTYQIVKNDATEGIVQLWARGASADLSWVTIRKTITLRAGESALRVKYRYENQLDSMTTVNLGFWVRNQFGDPGAVNTYHVPSLSGVKRTVRTAAGGGLTKNDFDYDVARGWTAFTANSGVGCAARFPYAPLMCLYNYYSGSVNTTEWLYRTLPIENGKEMTADVTIIPFAKMPAVDAVSEDIVAGFELPDKAEPGQKVAGAFHVTAARALRETFAIELSLLPQAGAPRQLLTKELSLQADAPQRIDFEFTPDKNGTYIVAAVPTLMPKDSPCVYRAVTVGPASGAFALAPEAKRLGNDQERLGQAAGEAKSRRDITLQANVESPHTAWARPYYLGKPRVLFIMYMDAERDIIELAQRVDVAFDTVSISGGKWYGAADLAKQNWEDKDSVAELERKLTGPTVYDAIVLAPSARMTKTIMTETVQKAIVERVKKGCGLVYMGQIDTPELVKMKSPVLDLLPIKPMKVRNRQGVGGQWRKSRAHFISDGFPYDAMPETFVQNWADDVPVPAEQKLVVNDKDWPIVTTGAAGQGRIVMLSWNQYNNERGCYLIPFLSHENRPGNLTVSDSLSDNKPRSKDYVPFRYADYYFSLTAKAIYWAAGRESALEIVELKPTAPEFQRAALNQSAIDVQLASANPTGADLIAVMTFRDEFDRVIASGKKSFRAEQGKTAALKFAVPKAMPGGNGFAQLHVYDGSNVVNWGATAFRMEQPAQVVSIAMPSEPLPLAPAQGSVHVKSAMPATLRLTARDSEGRAFDRVEIPVQPAGETDMPFTINLSNIRTLVAFVEAELLVGADCSDRLSRRIVLQKLPPEADWVNDVCSFTVKRNYYVQTWMEQAKALGVRKMLSPASAEACADANMQIEGGRYLLSGSRYFHYHHDSKRSAEYADLKKQYQQTHDKKFLVRTPCINDPKYREQVAKYAQELAATNRAMGLHLCVLADELSLTRHGDAFDFCYCEHCLAGFRQWTQKEYGGLKAANAEWGTAFKDLSEVVPLTFDEAQKDGRYASWADHKRFMELSLADFVRFCRAELRKIDPEAGIILSGTQEPRPWGGDDAWLRIHSFDKLYMYGEAEVSEMHHSLNPRLVMSKWSGYGGVVTANGTATLLFYGVSGYSFWHAPLFLNPDLNPSPGAITQYETTAPWMKGAAKLLLRSEQSAGGVAILYSQSSIRASAITGGEVSSYVGWVRLLNALDVGGQFISYEQLAEGALAKRGFRALILDDCIALSKKECKQIASFAKNGGWILADVRPAVFDDHCKAVNPGGLDDLFGIKTGEGLKSFQGSGAVMVTNLPDPLAALAGAKLHTMPVDTRILPNGAQALGDDSGAGAVFYRKAGKGAAVLLNLQVRQYINLAAGQSGREQGWLNLTRALLRAAGALPPIRVNEPDQDRPAAELVVRRFTSGAITYVGLIPSGKEKAVRELVLPEKRFVYDALAGQLLGEGTRVKFEVSPGEPKMLALLPYRVLGVVATAPETVKQGAILRVSMEMQAQGAQPLGEHVYHVALKDPQGRAAAWAAQNVVAPAGRAQIDIPVALGDEPGVWILRINDAATGAAQEAKINITGTAPAAAVEPVVPDGNPAYP